jgi:hypothetical protein
MFSYQEGRDNNKLNYYYLNLQLGSLTEVARKIFVFGKRISIFQKQRDLS